MPPSMEADFEGWNASIEANLKAIYSTKGLPRAQIFHRSSRPTSSQCSAPWTPPVRPVEP